MVEEIVAPLLVTEWGRRAGLGVAVCMIGFILITSVSMMLTWRSDFLLSRISAAMTVSHDTSSENITKWIAQIPDWHLFGKAGAAGLPVTSLQLHLVGVIKASPEKFSRVIISEGDQPGKVYQIGDTLSSGVKVYGITDNGVVLENGGNLETLPLQRPGLNFEGMPKPLLNDAAPEE
jgi:type II secretory pathway component PulC